MSILRPVDRAAIAIARALDDDESDVRVLVLDEPTAALPPHEVDLLFGSGPPGSEAGTSVIYVSHRLNEIFELADRATILRDGVSQGTVPMHELDHAELVAHDRRRGAWTCRAGDKRTRRRPCREGAAGRGRAGCGSMDIDLAVTVGEVLGIAGLTGSGREELAGRPRR